MVKENFKQIINLKNNLVYQDGAIVSKTLITNQDTSITLFAFDKGQEISTHTAPVDAMVQIVEGEADIKISDENFNLKEGDIILMPAREPHALFAKTKFKMLLLKLS